MTWRGLRPWLGLGARLVVGGVWIAAGSLKLGDLNASGHSVVAYRLIPFDAAMFVGAILPFLEVALGLLLLLGLATRVIAAISVVLFGAYIVAIASVWARGLRIDCGCFGTGGALTSDQRPQYAIEIIRDIALLLVAGFLVVFPRTRLSLDGQLLGQSEVSA